MGHLSCRLTNSVCPPRRDASRSQRTQTRRINLVGLKRRPEQTLAGGIGVCKLGQRVHARACANYDGRLSPWVTWRDRFGANRSGQCKRNMPACGSGRLDVKHGAALSRPDLKRPANCCSEASPCQAVTAAPGCAATPSHLARAAVPAPPALPPRANGLARNTGTGQHPSVPPAP